MIGLSKFYYQFLKNFVFNQTTTDCALIIMTIFIVFTVFTREHEENMH